MDASHLQSVVLAPKLDTVPLSGYTVRFSVYDHATQLTVEREEHFAAEDFKRRAGNCEHWYHYAGGMGVAVAREAIEPAKERSE